MKRRTFILSAMAVTAVAGLSVAVPVFLHFRKRHFESGDPLTTPEDLGYFCDEKALRAIGTQYRSAHADESSSASLQKLLLNSDKGTTRSFEREEDCILFLRQKIQDEFNKAETLVVDGWVLAPTEARQCALLSLT